MAVYRNPDYLGCYEPPMPGVQVVAVGSASGYQQTYPGTCFQTVAAVTATTSRGSATSTGAIIVTTSPPKVLWGSATYPQFEYLGCFLPLSIPLTGTGIYTTLTTTAGTVTDCMLFCGTAGGAGGTTYMATSLIFLTKKM